MDPVPPDLTVRPAPDDLVARLDAQLHQAQMRRRFGTGVTPPVVFRQWRIDRRLGRGGMGAVYLAFDMELRRSVALKIVALPRAADQEAQWTRVREEARAIAAIKHTNVVQIHQVHFEGDNPIIEMEYIDGPTLRVWQSEPRRAWQSIVAAYASAGDGLVAIHAIGLVHRDIKPDNLLMSSDGLVRVVDLGLVWQTTARDENRGPADARLGALVAPEDALAGTFGYIAPEVFAGGEPDHLGDQFSFCVALYEALFGVRPFHGDTPAELARAMGTGTLTLPENPPRVPKWLHTAVTRGLRCDRADRHPDVASLVCELRRGLARRRTWTLRTTLALAMTGLLALGYGLRATPHDPCAAADAAVALAPGAMASLEERVGVGTLPTQRSLAILTSTLDARARAWSGDRGQLCRAARREHVDPTPILRTWSCIDHRHAELLAIVDGLREADDDLAARIVDATTAVEQLPNCADPTTLAHWPAPEPHRSDAQLAARLTSALLHENAGHYHRAEALARDVIATAEPRLRSEALYRLGHILGAQDRTAAALPILDDAHNAAYALGADDLACQVVAYRAKLVSNVELDLARSERELAAAEACLQRTQPRTPALRADMLEARGLLAALADQPDLAVACHEEALWLRRTHLGERHMDVSKSLHNLGNSLESRSMLIPAQRRLEQALDLREQLVGDDHPRLADILQDLGHLHRRTGYLGAARRSFERAATILHDNGGSHAPVLADIEMSLAAIDLETDAPNAAASRLHRARQLQAIDADLAPSHPQRAVLLQLEAQLCEARGDSAGALRALTAATRLLRAHDPDSSEVLQGVLNEIPTRYALEDFVGIVAIVRDATPSILHYLREQPPEYRGLIAWYIGDSQLRERAPVAATYLELALAAYREQGSSDQVDQLLEELARAQRLLPPP